MAEGVVSFLLNKLSVWLQQEQMLLGGIKLDVESIRSELGQMSAFLRVADAKEESNPQLYEWVRQIREISYDTEDALDKYMLLHFAFWCEEGFIKKHCVSIKNLPFRHGIACEIKKIRSRLENASNSQQKFRDLYDFHGSTSNPECYDGRGDALLLEEADLVEIEEPKNQLLEWLSSNDYGLTVISIVGMGGSGKTTLARKVYEDENLKRRFDHHVWITVSESFKTEKLLSDIIRQLVKEAVEPSPNGLEDMNANHMREFINNFLKNKNYIIVLDDIWRIDAWKAIQHAFPRSFSCGRIIITSRHNTIGITASADANNCHVYPLKPLSEEESEQLFFRKAFRGKPCPHYLQDVSKSILKRCGGLPLAIIVVGGLLATKNNNIYDWNMLDRSFGHEISESDSLQIMPKSLSLSYYDLPYYLKSCFLYLSVFPEDEFIGKGKLIRLWIAEGFIPERAGKTMEETAEGYINELLSRNLILIATMTEDGMPKEFRIHDIVREYIISKSVEQNIVSTSSGGALQGLNKIRRVSVHSSMNLHAGEAFHIFEYLRSLLLFSSTDWEIIISQVFAGGRRLLKVLDLEGAWLTRIPDEVFKLHLLKYLSLRDTQVAVVPKSIMYLPNLETLDLKRTMVTGFPVQILKLLKLRHLLAYSYTSCGFSFPFDNIQSFKAPYEIGRLSSLQKLAYIDADDHQVNGSIKIVVEIGKLSQLRRLGIVNLRRKDGKDLCNSLAKLANLRSLSISSIVEDVILDLDHPISPLNYRSKASPFLQKLVLRGRLEKVPRWVSNLDGLTKLVLKWSKIVEDPLGCIQGLPNLVVLKMMMAYEGERLSFKAGWFPKLEQLHLTELIGLRWIVVEMGSLPSIREVNILRCPYLNEVPDAILRLVNHQHVYYM